MDTREAAPVDIRPVTADFAVAPQIAPEDTAHIAEAGYKSIMGNRPDDEGPGQPSYETIADKAKAAGLETAFVPVISGQMKAQDVADFQAAYDALPKPVLAYCRSGTRSITLWAVNQAKARPAADVAAETQAAGYDLSTLLGV